MKRIWTTVAFLGAGLSLSALVGISHAQTSSVAYIVNSRNDADDGACSVTHCSLREAINAANRDGKNSSIYFSESAFIGSRQTIAITTTLPLLMGNGSLTFYTPRWGVQISGGRLNQVFRVDSGANVRMIGLTIVDGYAGPSVSNAGGGIMNYGNLRLDNCTLTGNSADSGGAIFNASDLNGKTLTLTNCTFSGNGPSKKGGAIYNSRGLAVIQSCTITANRASSVGGGVGSQGFFSDPNNPTARTEVQNSIIAGNFGNDLGLGMGSNNSFVSYGYNLIGGGGPASSFYNVGDLTGVDEPALLALAENGGPTQTRALAGASKARNTGLTWLTTDQRNLPRPQEGACDKGALEANTPELAESLVVTTLADEDNVTSNPNYGTGTSLREAINYANRDGRNSVITFSSSVFGAPRKTIALSGGNLPAIVGDGTLTIATAFIGVEISGNDRSRAFKINPGANVFMMGLTIRNGYAIGLETYGGGVYNGGSLTMTSCTLTGNRADSGGAIVSGGSGALTLRNCTISGNMARGQGGGIYAASALTTIDSCTITNNSAPAGMGGGIMVWDAQTQVRNSIIAGNIGGDVALRRGTANTFVSYGYNLIGYGDPANAFNKVGDVINNANPGLYALANHGGPGLTHKLMASSPALNTGGTTLTEDQRGVVRPQGGVKDKGAFELLPGE